jgi:hypothetical protein
MRSMTKAAVCVLLGGCGTVQYAPTKPPGALLQDCTEVVPKLSTNGSLAIYAADLKQALKECTADKRALRVWAELKE